MSAEKTERGGNLSATWARREVLAAAIVTLWIVILHVQNLLCAGPLWRDEVGTVDFASMPTLGDLWHNLQYDNFPPLFVLIARGWMQAGLSADFSLRVLGLLIGLATLAVLWLGARACGARTPLLALALYALNPLAIRVGDSLRPYGLGYALALLTMVLIWKFLENPRPRALIWAAVAAILSVQCLFHNAVFLVTFSLGAWGVALARRQGKTAARIGVIGGAAALSLLPLLPVILQGADWRSIDKHPVTFGQLGGELLNALNSSGSWAVWAWAVAAAASVVLAIPGFRAGRSAAGIMLYCAVLVPAGWVFYFVFLQKMGLQPRTWYFLILLAPSALALDLICAPAPDAKACPVRVVLALLLTAASVRPCLAGVQTRQSNADIVAQTLEQNVQPGDTILVSPWFYGVSLQRYFGTNQFATIPPMSELRIHRYDLMKRQMEADSPMAPVLDQVRQSLRSGHALWVAGVFQFPPPGPPQPVYGPYQGGMENSESVYFSSWMFQISSLVQTHATSAEQLSIPTPGGVPVKSLEDMPVLMFRGWKE